MSYNNNECNNTIIKKRGRKSKKHLENNLINYNNSNENIIVNIQDKIENAQDLVNDFLNLNNKNELQDYTSESKSILITNDTNLTNFINENQDVAKKRGRKPKGGKIIQQTLLLTNAKENRPNVILHLKCFLKI